MGRDGANARKAQKSFAELFFRKATTFFYPYVIFKIS